MIANKRKLENVDKELGEISKKNLMRNFLKAKHMENLASVSESMPNILLPMRYSKIFKKSLTFVEL